MKTFTTIGLTFLLTLAVFVLLVWAYQTLYLRSPSHTVYVSKDCILNEVVAGADYVFDCPN